jgi:hypothetical protein
LPQELVEPALDCELLEVLCDTIAVEDFKEEKQKQVNQMNAIMDLRAKARLNIRQKEAEKAMEQETRHCREENSQIIFAEKRRKVAQDQMAGIVGSRKFVSLE